MNNVFQLDKVYSNAAFYTEAAHYTLNSARFITNLYNNADRCPCPKAYEYACRLISETKEVFTYFVPVHRTRCFLKILVNNSYYYRVKIRKDDEGNEFVILGNTILRASDLLKYTLAEANAKYLDDSNRLKTKNYFIRKMSEIEDGGYTYIAKKKYAADGTCLSNATKIETEEELRDYLSLNN